MAWSKVKTIIIVILLVLNLFLLLLVADRQISSSRYEADTLRKTAEALSLNGIDVSAEALPSTMDLPGISVVRSEEAEAAAARLLLSGDIITTNSGSMSVYSSVSGNVSFQSNGDFSATLSLDWTQFSSPAEHAAALLEQMGAQVWNITTTGDTVTVIQSANGAPAYNVRLTLTYAEDCLTAMEGKLLLGTSTPDSEQGDVVTVPTALISLLEYIIDSGMVCRSIDSMTPGYLTAASLSDPVRLTPCWYVVTDTASFYLDAATGSVTRAS